MNSKSGMMLAHARRAKRRTIVPSALRFRPQAERDRIMLHVVDRVTNRHEVALTQGITMNMEEPAMVVDLEALRAFLGCEQEQETEATRH